ncbi:MAG: hypothetical protein WCI93_02630 [bacterium]
MINLPVSRGGLYGCPKIIDEEYIVFSKKGGDGKKFPLPLELCVSLLTKEILRGVNTPWGNESCAIFDIAIKEVGKMYTSYIKVDKKNILDVQQEDIGINFEYWAKVYYFKNPFLKNKKLQKLLKEKK